MLLESVSTLIMKKTRKLKIMGLGQTEVDKVMSKKKFQFCRMCLLSCYGLEPCYDYHDFRNSCILYEVLLRVSYAFSLQPTAHLF